MVEVVEASAFASVGLDIRKDLVPVTAAGRGRLVKALSELGLITDF